MVMLFKQFPKVVLTVGILLGLQGCAGIRQVLIHADQKDDTHYILIKGKRLYDCYSKVDGKWVPTCKEVKTYDITE